MSKKNKPSGKLRMDELVPIDLNAEQSVHEEELNIIEQDFNEEFAMKIKQHNFNIREFHEDYANFVPNGYSLLVRPYCKEITITEEGVIIPNREVIGIPTKAGPGGTSHYEMITDPYGFSRKAVVVSVSNESTMKEKYSPGDIVYLANVIRPTPMGKGNDVKVYIPNLFIHPVSGPDEPPTDPTDPHYGYLLVYEQDIQGTDRRFPTGSNAVQAEENRAVIEQSDSES